MKKTTVSLAAIMLVLTMGFSSVFAADASEALYNGITVFSIAPASNNSDTVTADSRNVFNGITFFGTSTAATSKAAFSEGAVRFREQKNSYNGITVFSKG